VLREGQGAILRKGNDVFYNPAQARSVTRTAVHVASAARGVPCACCMQQCACEPPSQHASTA
jgi:hypothetical protein